MKQKQGCEGAKLVNHQQGGGTMFKQLKGQKGFTLIELMIVVAIIGILAAIAIPNFLTYQLKSRQAEAKTNLQAIKTSEVAFQAERGCYIGIAPEPVLMAVPAGGAKAQPVVWGQGQPPTAPGALWCTALYGGSFADVGFKATGNVLFRYGVDATTAPTVAGFTGYTTAQSCPLAIIGAVGIPTALPAQNNFMASAQSNLDGDTVGVTNGVSSWASTVDHGANDCTTGVY
jgi:type IV pilus assembly protein PilA